MLKLDPTNTELVTQKQKVLAQNIEETSEKLKLLKETQQKADDAIANGTKISDENYRNLQREIINTENKLKDLQVQASKWTEAGKAAEEWGNKIQSLGNKIDSVGNKLITRLTLPLTTLGIVGIQSAAQQEAAMQQVELIYGKAADSIKKFAENTAISYNMSTSDAYKYSQIYGNLIQSITDDEKENALYTQQLLKASSIIASATGRTMEDVMDRIRSGLLGNTEAIEDLGVNVNVAMIESTDAFKKFAGDKTWKQLDFQTQQQIRLFAILEQTTKKYGDEVNKNTASDIQNLTAKFTNLTSKLSKKLLPIANKLIDKADDFLDKLDDLTDEEIDNIIQIGLMVAAAGPLVKILGTTTKVAGGAVKGLGTLSQAIALTGKTSTTAFGQASSATQTLAKAFTALTSPAGLAVTAVGTLAGAIVYFSQKQTDAQKAAKELADEMASQKQELDEYVKSVDETTSANLSEVLSVQSLRDELDLLVDENGKVKKGYESRVDFILSELNNALGTEYELNGDIINSYKNLQDEIDTLIEKKKAEIILSGSEEKFRNAIENQTTAIENMKNAYEQLNPYLEQYDTDLDGLKDKAEELRDLQEEWFAKPGPAAYLKSEEYRKEAEAIENIISAFEDAQSSVETYTENVQQYTDNYALYVEGKYDEISANIIGSTKNWTDASLQEINSGITEQKKALDSYKVIYENTGNEVAQELNEQANENLEKLAEELVKRTSTISDLGESEKEAWKNLAKSSHDIYYEYVSKMPADLQDAIENATGILAIEYKMVDASETLASKVRKQFRESVEAEKSGEYFVEGVGKGIEDKSATAISIANNFAKNILKNFNKSLEIHSPSKLSEESGENFVEGTMLGITNKEREALNLVNKFGRNIMGKFNQGLATTSLNPNFSEAKLSSTVIDSTKTIFTTPQIVFNVQELDEAKLEQCFNYVNRKFGSQY